jgi:aminoglycoside phosphotransferase (APT) family kinase protein
MEFLKGRIFSNVSFPEIAREERDALWYEAVSVLARLHAVVPKDIGLDGYGASKDYYPRQFRSLTKISNAQAAVSNAKTGTSVGPIPRLEEMLTWFRANRPIDECTIVHGDYKIDNLVFHPTEARIIGILDWELSTLGHPLSDLANLLQPFSIPAGVMPAPAVGLRDVRPLPIPSESELELHYCSIAHRPYPIPSWDFARAFSFFRLSVICQGIAARVAHGQASSAEAATFARLFTPVAHLALEIVDDSTSAGSAKAKL